MRLLRNSRSSEQGFTLIEILVAILIGAIVMGMAIAVLGVTNSASLRVISKTEVQQNTRASIAVVFDSLANADSFETCRVAYTRTDQEKISGTQMIPPAPLGRSGVLPDDCKETVGTGRIIVWAQPNRLCYFDKQTVDDPELLRCISRGGAGGSSRYFPAPIPAVHLSPSGSEIYSDGTSTNYASCVNASVGTDPNLVYLFTCAPNLGANPLTIPDSYGSPNPDTQAVIADLGDEPPERNLFRYILDEETAPSTTTSPGSGSDEVSGVDSVDFADQVNIIGVNISLWLTYDDHRASSSGHGTYKYRQTIILRKSNKALEENYNG